MFAGASPELCMKGSQVPQGWIRRTVSRSGEGRGGNSVTREGRRGYNNTKDRKFFKEEEKEESDVTRRAVAKGVGRK
jgi:hypothetical protein